MHGGPYGCVTMHIQLRLCSKIGVFNDFFIDPPVSSKFQRLGTSTRGSGQATGQNQLKSVNYPTFLSRVPLYSNAAGVTHHQTDCDAGKSVCRDPCDMPGMPVTVAMLHVGYIASMKDRSKAPSESRIATYGHARQRVQKQKPCMLTNV